MSRPTARKSCTKTKARSTNEISDHKLTVCFGRNCYDKNPRPVTLTMTELGVRFCKPNTNRGKLPLANYLALDKKVKDQAEIRRTEKDGEYFIATTFTHPGTRDADDVLFTGAFVGDIDTGNVSFAELKARLAGYQYIVYSSYSHQASSPRWRFIVPYASPCTRAQHEKVYAFFQKQFGGQLDSRCKTTNQIWYTPACPYDAVDLFEFFIGQGSLLDVDSVPEVAAAPPHKKPTSKALSVPRAANLGIAELARLRDALSSLPSDDRDIWIKVGIALRRELGDDDGKTLWMEWSLKSDKFDEDDALATWNSLKVEDRERAVTLGTVFHLAMAHGWSASPTQAPDYVEDFNRKHFMAIDGGKTWVFREEIDPELGRDFLNRIKPADFKSFYANKVSSTVVNNVVVMRNTATAWIQHPERRSYHGLTFLPGRTAPLGNYNLWRGFPVEPVRGNWNLLQAHIRHVICSGQVIEYEYLLNWMAFAVQHPECPAGVAVVLKGARGTGKGKLASIFGSLFGQHALQINQSRHLTGNFNAHLRSCVFLFVDEALWAGDKAGENVLKGLITEATIAIENKGQNVVTAPNRLHVMMASNNDWVVPAGPMDRRYFVLHVSEQRMQDHAYFAAIDDQIFGHGGLGAMMHDLLERDLSKFQIRQFPRTSALDEQVLRSLDADMTWWLEHLGRTFTPPDWKFQPRSILRNQHGIALGPNSYGKSTETRFGMFLRNVIPGGLKKVSVATSGGKTLDCYEFPDQPTCRKYVVGMLGLVGDPWA